MRSGGESGNKLLWFDVTNNDRAAAYDGMTSNGYMILNRHLPGNGRKIAYRNRAPNGGGGHDNTGSTDIAVVANLYEIINFGAVANLS